MNNLKNTQLITIKKLIAVGCAILCTLLMFTKMFRYTATTTFTSGSDSVTMSGEFSLVSFLFNENLAIMDSKVEFLREIFAFSYVIMWISFSLCVISLIVLIIGALLKKTLVSKIGGISLMVSIILNVLVSFNRYPSGNTIRYIEFFTIPFVIAMLLGFIVLFLVFSIDNSKRTD